MPCAGRMAERRDLGEWCRRNDKEKIIVLVARDEGAKASHLSKKMSGELTLIAKS